MGERWKKTLVGLAMVLLLFLGGIPEARAAPAREIDPDAIDALLADQLRRHRLPGGAAAVARADGSVHLFARGNAAPDTPMSPDTPMYIASLSKPITAVAVMQLVERDLLDLDAPVVEYLPEFTVADPEVSERITPRHLLTHTSGLSDAGHVPSLPVHAELDDAVADLARLQPVAPPGEQYSYFNAGYSVLGRVIEEVSGLAYGRYLQRYLFEPLGMHNTFTDPEAAREAGLATGHGSLFGWPIPREQPFLAHDLPAGFIISTARDMGRYAAALLGEGSLGYARILSPEGVEALWEYAPVFRAPPAYALGWSVEAIDGHRALAHTGSLENYAAHMVLLPDEEVGAVLLLNGNHLLYTALVSPTLSEAIAGGLLGTPPDSGISLGVIGPVLLFLFLVSAGLSVRAALRLVRPGPGGPKAPSQYGKWDILLPLGGALAILVGLPVAAQSIIGRGVTWSLFVTMAPDIGGIILVPVITALSVGLFRLIRAVGARAAGIGPPAPQDSGASRSTQDCS